MESRVNLGYPDWSSTLYNLAYHKFIRELLQPGDKILNLGCGYGYTSLLFAEKGYEIECVDASEGVNQVNRNRYTHKNVNYVKADVFSFDSENKFDVVLMLDLIEHFKKKEGELLIKKYSEYLTNGGMLVIGTPRYLPVKKRTRNRQENHVHEYTYKDLESTLRTQFNRVIIFSQTDEVISTSYSEYAWRFIALGLYSVVKV